MFTIPPQLLEDVLNYLAGKPYKEVANLINQLANLQKLEDEKPKDKK